MKFANHRDTLLDLEVWRNQLFNRYQPWNKNNVCLSSHYFIINLSHIDSIIHNSIQNNSLCNDSISSQIVFTSIFNFFSFQIDTLSNIIHGIKNFQKILKKHLKSVLLLHNYINKIQFQSNSPLSNQPPLMKIKEKYLSLLQKKNIHNTKRKTFFSILSSLDQN